MSKTSRRAVALQSSVAAAALAGAVFAAFMAGQQRPRQPQPQPTVQELAAMTRAAGLTPQALTIAGAESTGVWAMASRIRASGTDLIQPYRDAREAEAAARMQLERLESRVIAGVDEGGEPLAQARAAHAAAIASLEAAKAAVLEAADLDAGVSTNLSSMTLAGFEGKLAVWQGSDGERRILRDALAASAIAQRLGTAVPTEVASIIDRAHAQPQVVAAGVAIDANFAAVQQAWRQGFEGE